MPEYDILLHLSDRQDEMRKALEAAHDEVKNEIIGMNIALQQLTNQVTQQNGRVTKNSERIDRIIQERETEALARERAIGRLEGASGVVLTRKQLAAAAAVFGTITASAAAIFEFALRVWG